MRPSTSSIAANLALPVFLFLASLLSGCFAGTAGAVLGLMELSDDDGGTSDAPPQVTQFRVEPHGSPDVLLIEFQLANDDSGTLGVQIEYEPIASELSPGGSRRRATLLPGSDRIDEIPPFETVRVFWDAETDLGGDSGQVQINLTPVEDGAGGESFVSEAVRAGNTPVEIRGVDLSSREDQITVSFELVDRESDPIDLVGLDLSVDGGEFHGMPEETFQELPANTRKGLPSSPEGVRVSLSFSVSRLERPDALRLLASPGFVGLLQVRVGGQDFPAEQESSDPFPEPPFRFDTNDPPSLTLIPILPEHLRSGIIPIRYTLSDPQRNKANIEVMVDLGDGLGPRRANEFPSHASDGTRNLATHLGKSLVSQVVTRPALLAEDDRGGEGHEASAPHVFLWDALSQARGDENVTVTIRVSDRWEEGNASQQQVTLSFTWLEKVGTVRTGDTPTALTCSDYDNDGFLDVVVANQGDGTLTHLRGGPRGLQFREDVSAAVQEIEGRILKPVAVASGDYDGDGFPDVAVANESANMVTCVLGGSDGLRPQDEVETGDAPVALVSGDFNKDGIDDLVVANSSSNDVSLLVGGRAGLRVLQTVDVGVEPVALAIGDFNGDGFPDIAVANRGSGTVTWLRSGSFLLERIADIETGVAPVALTSADYEGDNYDGVVVANNESASVVYLRGGAGGLEPGAPIATGLNPEDLVSADFDRDGFLDVVVANSGSEYLTILRGSPDGLSRAGEKLEVGDGTGALARGDFDGDGFFDVLAASWASNGVAFARGGPDGPQLVKTFTAGRQPVALLGADYNGDGIDDAVTANHDSDSVTLLRGGSGGLVNLDEIDVGSQPQVLTTGDYDADGFVDVVVANRGSGNVHFLRGGPDGLTRVREIAVDPIPAGLATGDLNGDGYPDVVVTSGQDPGGVYLLGGPTGVQRGGRFALTNGPLGGPDTGAEYVVAGDFNGDGLTDFLAANDTSGNLSYLQGGESGLGVLPQEIAAVREGPFREFSALTSADYDGDGSLDAVVVQSLANHGTFVRGCGRRHECLEGLTPEGERVHTGSDPSALATGDYNGDGFLDLVVTNRGSNDVTYLRWEAERGGLSAIESIEVGSGPVAVSSADCDGDGFPDVAVASGTSEEIASLRGGPAGLSIGGARIALGGKPKGTASGDFNGDGFRDVIVTLEDTAKLTLLRGGWNGLSWTGELPTGVGAGVLTSADFDGDGLLDVAVANSDADTISYLRQRYLVRHPNRVIDCESSDASLVLEDPRWPSRYRLELPAGAFCRPTQVCLTPQSIFALPQGEAFRNGTFLSAVTECVCILRESTVLDSATPAYLTLRLEYRDPAPTPEVLRAFRCAEGRVTALAQELNIVDFARGKGVTFPVSHFGSYVVAILRER